MLPISSCARADLECIKVLMGWQQLPISSRARADRRCITVLMGWHLPPISSRVELVVNACINVPMG